MIISKRKLINLSTPDSNISELQSTNPKLYSSIKNLGDAGRVLVSMALPPTMSRQYIERFILTGHPAVANDVYSSRYHIILPVDITNSWNYLRIDLLYCYITAKIQGATGVSSFDFKVSQNKGRATFTSLFKSGLNPILPKLTTFVNNTDFAIGSLYQDDLLRIDVLVSDATISGVELVLVGNYIVEEK